MNRRAQLICAWCGPACAVLFAIGAALLAQVIPPQFHPTDSAQQIAHTYAANRDSIRIGCFIAIISMSLIAPWGVSIATQFRRREGGYPVLTYVQLVSIAIGVVVVVFMCMFWAAAAYRAGDVSPEFTRTLNDVAYFAFLYTWPPFAIWALAIALAIFMDRGAQPAYPRWVGYLSLWTTLLFVPAGLMSFFKTGAFAYNGLLALYVPVLIFFVWLAALTVCTIQNVKRGRFDEDERGPEPARLVTEKPPELAGAR